MMGFEPPVEEDFFVVDFGALALEALPGSVSDEDGRFEVRSRRVLGTPEDLYKWQFWYGGAVLVTLDGYASSTTGYFFDDPPDRDFGDITLDREFEVTGRIVDAQGAALAGAEVRLDHLSRWDPRRRMLDSGKILRLGGLDRARTDESGRFRFRRLGTGGAFFSVDREGHAAATLTVAGASGGAVQTGEIALPRARSITGIVADEGGIPVAGAEVWLADANFDRRRTPGVVRGPPRWYEEGTDRSRDLIEALRKHRVPHAETDGRGGFGVSGRGSPSYDLYTSAPGYRLYRAEDVAVGQNVEVVLRPEESGPSATASTEAGPPKSEALVPVTVQVDDEDGKRVPGADVYALRYPGGPGKLQGRTGPDGRLRFEARPDAPAVVYAALGNAGVSERARIAPADDATGERQGRLVLHPPGGVSGTVHGEDGGAIPYGWVDIRPLGEGDPWLQPHARDVRADAEGHFEIGGLPEGRYRLDTGYDYDRGSGIEVWVGAGRTATVRIQYQRGATRITGTVRAGSEPVAWAEVEGFRRAEPGAYFFSLTGADGSFDGRAEQPGDYELSVESPVGGRAGPKSVTVVEGERARVDFELPTGSIEGKVLGADGEGVGAVFVLLPGPDDTEEDDQDLTGADGSFRFSYLGDGVYTLYVVRTGFGFDYARMTLLPAKFEVTVRGGQSARPSLRVARGRSVWGSVRLPSGVGARDGTQVGLVQVEPEPEPAFLDEGYTAVTYSWLGRYQFHGLAAGTYRLLAEAGSADEVRERGTEVEVGSADLAGVDLTLENPGPRPRRMAGPAP